MAINPNIVLGIRPAQIQQNDPLEQYGKSLTLKNLMGQGEMQAMQMDKARRDVADEEMYREAVKASGGSLERLIPELTGRGLGRQAMDAQGKLLTNKKTDADYRKTLIQSKIEEAKYLRDRLAGVRDQAGYDQWRQEGAAMGAQVVNSAPEVFDPSFQQNQILTADKFLERMTPKFERVDLGGKVQVIDVNPFTNPSIKGTALDKTATPGDLLTDKRTRDEGALNRGVTMRGQNLTDARARETASAGKWTNDLANGVQVNMQTGETRPITEGGQPVMRQKPLTETQGKAQMFGTRAAEADKVLQGLEQKINVPALAAKQAIQNLPFGIGAIPGAVANYALSEDQQKVEQAQRNFVNAVLRQESGAVISQPEFDNAAKQYFPQPGDSAAVIEQKRQNRQSAIEGFRLSAGNAGERVERARQIPPSREAAGQIDPSKLSDAEIKRELGLK